MATSTRSPDATPQRRTGSGAAARASVLWVIVGAGLAYGVAETAVKVAALFAG